MYLLIYVYIKYMLPGDNIFTVSLNKLVSVTTERSPKRYHYYYIIFDNIYLRI